MNNEAMNPVKKHFLLPLLIITLERNTQKDTIADLFIFLVQYSFLCNEPSSGDKILKRDVSYSGELSSQKSNGARYLDPKYSRWISVDPALSDYVSGNSNGSSGGVYNPTNLNLYHYGNNNPIKYLDPDGREEYDSTITYEQWKQIPGCGWFDDLSSSEKTLVGKTWEETQDFFKKYPNGCIYRNPDEAIYSYRYYTNEGNDFPHYYNMYTGDELFIFGIAKGLFNIGRGLIKGLMNIAGKELAETGKTILSKNLQKHILIRHTLDGLRSQVGHRPISELIKKTIFNPEWSTDKILRAADKAVKEAFKHGVTNGKYTTKVFGETITTCINNGIVDTVYGAIMVTEEMLLK